MRKSILSIAIFCVLTAAAEPRRIALVVQNHTSDVPTLPMASFADTLTSRLAGKTFRVVNPYNVIGVNQNRTSKGEMMPEASAQEIARMLGAQGFVTAAIQEFTGEDIQWNGKVVAHTLKVRLALNLVDSATGETICGVDGVEFSKNYTAEKVKSDTATLYEGLMHGAAAKAAAKLLAKVADSDWNPAPVKVLRVFFGCNVLGAKLKIDGMFRGTCPMEYEVTPGFHKLQVAYPPYYFDGIDEMAMFDQEGQKFKVVLQLTPEGEAQRSRSLEYEAKLVELKKSQLEVEKMKDDNQIEYEKKKLALEREKKSIEAEQSERCELFKKQLDLVDAMLKRYKRNGDTDDYVRRKMADGKSVFWSNSFNRVLITDGTAENVEFYADGDEIVIPSDSNESSKLIQKFTQR